MAATMDKVEAVIISGPRKGEIISVPEVALNSKWQAMKEEWETLSDEEVAMLNRVLDDAIAAADRLLVELRSGTEEMRQQREKAA